MHGVWEDGFDLHLSGDQKVFWVSDRHDLLVDLLEKTSDQDQLSVYH